MNFKYTTIISSLLLCSTLSNICSASDDYVDVYTPSTSSKIGLLKAGLMGIGLMSMASPAESVPIKGFVGCYLGTIDPQDSPNMDYIRIKTIKSTPCNFYYNYTSSQFTPIDITMSITCKDPDCFNVRMYSINFCSQYFDLLLNGGVGSAKLLWDYLKEGKYEKFALNVADGNLEVKDNLLNHYSFNTAFANYMNTGKCN